MRNRSRAPFLLGLAATLLVACGKKEIFVLDESGMPLQGVTVSVASKTGQITHFITDQDGRAYYGDVTGDGLVVTVDSNGFEQKTFRAGAVPQVTLSTDDTSDSDGDGLSDQEESTLLTDPFHVDTDRDGLPDGLEARILSSAPIVAMGANPRHKTLFVEVDWDAGRPETSLTDTAVSIVNGAFAKAPVANPDGSTGIRLIVDRGEFGGGSGSNQLIASERQAIFYHTDTSQNLGGLFGYAELPGRNHWIQGDFSDFGAGEGFVEAIVWMHELGHNLGLRHGGNDDVLCKPNYISVMNYNPFMALSFSYSKGDRPFLDELALSEPDGIGFGGVDWSKNYRIDQGTISADIDGHTPINLIQWLLNIINPVNLPPDLGTALSQERCRMPYNITTHHDHNDWTVVEDRLDDEVSFLLEGNNASSINAETSYSPLETGPIINDTFEFPQQFSTLLDVLLGSE